MKFWKLKPKFSGRNIKKKSFRNRKFIVSDGFLISSIPIFALALFLKFYFQWGFLVSRIDVKPLFLPNLLILPKNRNSKSRFAEKAINFFKIKCISNVNYTTVFLVLLIKYLNPIASSSEVDKCWSPESTISTSSPWCYKFLPWDATVTPA